MKQTNLLLGLLMACLIGPLTSFSQNVRVGADATLPATSAALEIPGTNGGILFPRMTEAQRLAIAGGAPATGLKVYQTDGATGLYVFNGTTWNILHQENIHGIVDTTGYFASTPPHAIGTLVGGGYSAMRLGQGRYEVTFTSPFTKAPSTMITAHNIGGIPPIPPPPTANYCLPFFFAACVTAFNQDQVEAVRLESHRTTPTPHDEVMAHGVGLLPTNPAVAVQNAWIPIVTPLTGPNVDATLYANYQPGSGCSTALTNACQTPNWQAGNYSFADPALAACSGIYQGWDDNTNSLAPGNPIKISALPADSYEIWVESSRAWSDAMGVWIDYNADGDFNDLNECLGTFAGPPSSECPSQGSVTSFCSNPTWLGSFDVPTAPGEALNGQTVLRVMSSWTGGSFGGPLNCATHDCRIATWGETEDYFVEIINATPVIGDSVPPRPANCNVFEVTTSGFKANCYNLNGNLTDTKFHWEAEQQ